MRSQNRALHYRPSASRGRPKNRLDKFWSDQEVLFDYDADLSGIGNRSIVLRVLIFVILTLFLGYRGLRGHASVISCDVMMMRDNREYILCTCRTSVVGPHLNIKLILSVPC